MQNKGKIKGKLITIGVLAVVLTVLLLLKNNVAVCEFFATTFARGWIWLTGNMFGWIPLSFYELFLIVAISCLIVTVVFLIIHLSKKRFVKALSLFLSLGIVALAGVNLYTTTATMTYNRQPLPSNIYTTYTGDDLSFDEAVQIAEYIIGEANRTYRETEHDQGGNIILPTMRELNELIAEEYKKLDNDYFSQFTPKVKRILNKRIMSEMHIVGVFFAPFGEPNINGGRMDLFTPSTMAHELAHSKGVMQESDANIVSLYVLLTSDNNYLKYSALMECMYEALDIVQTYPNSQLEYDRLYDLIDNGIIKERQNYTKYWWSFTLLGDIGEFFNDIYLKLQGEQSGTDSYVRPPIFEIVPGDPDDFGNPIINVINFSDMQNVLIGLYKSGAFA